MGIVPCSLLIIIYLLEIISRIERKNEYAKDQKNTTSKPLSTNCQTTIKPSSAHPRINFPAHWFKKLDLCRINIFIKRYASTNKSVIPIVVSCYYSAF